jgi:hypothetical protein
MRVITDEKALRKLIDPSVRRLYDEAMSEAARSWPGSKREARSERCLPVRVALLITFAGPVEDLVVAGLESASAVLSSDGSFVGGGFINPMRIGELAAIPHVSTIRLTPELFFTLNHPERPGTRHAACAGFRYRDTPRQSASVAPGRRTHVVT